MAKKVEPRQLNYTVCVVGLSGTENVKGPTGVGKSCLCNRFVRPSADDYFPEHLSLLSAADFNGQVVNNDHFLYWGTVSRHADDSSDYTMHVIEQTEFLDDTSFQPLRSGKTDAYLKRCSQTKVQSAEKLMYICRDQLGIEDSFPKVHFPSGKVTVDGFVCVVDVSRSQQRSMESQLDFVSKILAALMKTKKPIVLAATKMDEGHDAILHEVHKLVGRKELKGAITVVETSAASNVNTDLAFMVLASMIDKSKVSRPKIITYSEAAKLRNEKLDAARQAYGLLLNNLITDYQSVWTSSNRMLSRYVEYVQFVELFGKNQAKRQFNMRTRQLREDFLSKRKADYMNRAPRVIRDMLPDLPSISGRSWSNCQRVMAHRQDFNEYFARTRVQWFEDDNFLQSGDTRIPFDFMASQEVEILFKEHVNQLQAEMKRLEMKRQFAELLGQNKNVLPGMPLKEVEIFFLGRECFDYLNEVDKQSVYRESQLELKEAAKKDFQELLYERSEIFHAYDDPEVSITQEDVETLMNVLRSEPKCKALSRCEEDRKVIMLNHLGFMQFPIKEQCPFRANCMEITIQRCLNTRMKRPQNNPNWQLNPDEKQINLLILGTEGLAFDLVNEIRYHYPDDEYRFDDNVFSLDYKTIDDDVSLPHNALKSPDFTAHGCICIYSSSDTLDFIRDAMSKTFLANNAERLQYNGLPLVLVQAYDNTLSEKGYMLLRDEGRQLAARLKCQFIDAPDVIDMEGKLPFYENQVPRAMREIAISNATVDSVDGADGYGQVVADIRILLCLMCGDPFPVDTVLQPFLSMQSCYVVTNDRYHVLQFDTFIDDIKRKVEIIVASYHDATLLKDELCHGYILVYSAKRKASYAVLESSITKMMDIPTLIVAVNDRNMLLTNKGKLLSQKHNTHFITTSQFLQRCDSPYLPLLKDAWEYQCLLNRITSADEMSSSSNTFDTSPGSLPLYSPYQPYLKNSPNEPNKTLLLPYSSSTGSRKQWDSRGALYLGDSNNVEGKFWHLFSSEDSRKGRLLNIGEQSKRRVASFEALNYEPLFTDPETSLASPQHCRLSSNSLTLEHQHYYSDIVNQTLPCHCSTHGAWADNNEMGPIMKDRLPLADLIEVGDYEQPIDALSETSDDYALVQDALPAGKIQRVHSTLKRNAIPAFPSTDSESDISTLGRPSANQSPAMIKRAMSPLSGRRNLQVQTPERKANSLPRTVVHRVHSEWEHTNGSVTNTMRSDTPSEGSESAGDDKKKTSVRRKRSLRLTRKKHGEADGDDDHSFLEKLKNSVSDPERQKKREEKRKQKEEEKLIREKQKSVKRKLKSRLKRKSYLLDRDSGMTLQDYVQSEGQLIPKFVDLCVKYLENEGLLSEGLYRVSGNTAQMELLKEMFDHDKNINISTLDISINTVAAALKNFFSELREPLVPTHLYEELATAYSIPEKSSKLLALRGVLKKLPPANHEVLRYLMTHLYKISRHSDLNSMGSENLAICWWPTLIRPDISCVDDVKTLGTTMQDVTKTVIDQHGFIFYNEHEV